METIGGIILGLFILVVLVVLHELGHAIVARRNGVVVEEFGIGFPPSAWSTKLKNGVVFSLNWLPLGGFVKLQGENDAADKKGDYGAASFKNKTKILFAGVFVNWVTAVILFTGLALFGLPKVVDNQFSIASDTTTVTGPVTIVSTVKDYPAEKSGLKSGDEILKIAGQEVTNSTDFINVVKQLKGNKVEFTYSRDGVSKDVIVELRGEGAGSYFGATLDQQTSQRSTWSAPIVGVGVTTQLTFETLKGLVSLIGNLVSGIAMQLSPNSEDRQIASDKLGSVGENVAGPIGILGVIFPAAGKAGLTTVVLLTAIISLTLAVMNLLPIPSLDGGRWFVTAIYKAMKKPLTKEKEEKIHGTGFMILMLLVVMITVGDVTKLFK